MSVCVAKSLAAVCQNMLAATSLHQQSRKGDASIKCLTRQGMPIIMLVQPIKSDCPNFPGGEDIYNIRPRQ